MGRKMPKPKRLVTTSNGKTRSWESGKMSNDLDKCPLCGNMKKKEYSCCFNCKQKQEQPQKDKYREGMRTGLAHNLAVQYLISLKIDDTNFWGNYNETFKKFKQKIEELE